MSVKKIHDLLATGRTLSFEFFPPKSDAGQRSLEKALAELTYLEPAFVSVTYGAGGSTRGRTREVVADIERTYDFPAMPHLTCMGHTKGEILELLDGYAGDGVANVLALAGDPPDDGSPATGDFTYASELVELLRETGDFSVGVAAFPEVHPRSPDRQHDRRFLAEKLEAADFGITQCFFDAESYLRMRDDLDALGCDVPVLPGVIPVTNPKSVRRFADMNGAAVAEDLWERLDRTEDAGDRVEIAVEFASEMVVRLLAEGAPGIHVYTLNRALPTMRIAANCGLTPGYID